MASGGGARSRALSAAASLLLAAFIGGCALARAPHAATLASDRSALLVAPSAATRAELARALSAALNGASIRLADDALTSDSALIVTRMQRRDAAGRPILGRSSERPERFDLVKRADECILIHERTGRRWILHSAHCVTVADHGEVGARP